MQHRVVVVGAGHAGLASALALKDAGLEPVVFEEADRVASSWHVRYDSLRLNTWKRFSHLPGRPYPKGTPTFPSRQQLIEHLDRHAGEEGIDLRLGIRVERIDRDDGEWIVRTGDGDLRSPQVIVATGLDRAPAVPDWPGREQYGGELLHSSDYRNPAPFVGRRVLVVGTGSSGLEIATELADDGAAQVWLAVRTPPNIVLRKGVGPLPGDLVAACLFRLPERLGDRLARLGARMDIGDLSEHGLPWPERGLFEDLRIRDKVPAIVDEGVIEAIKSGRVAVVGAVARLDRSGVELADGERLEPEAVICATGYGRGLEPLVGHLGVLDDRGVPSSRGIRPAAEGLRFIGYVPRPGAIGYVGREAKGAAKAIARELRRSRDAVASRNAAAER
jgi:glycine/D-amino acid oxidase-like deaminating enzyme